MSDSPCPKDCLHLRLDAAGPWCLRLNTGEGLGPDEPAEPGMSTCYEPEEARMNTILHPHVSVRGFLLGHSRDCRRMFKHKNGRWFTPREAKAKLADLLAQGVEALPIGQPCEGFDYKTGCPGHPSAEP